MSGQLQAFFGALNDQEAKFLPILASDNLGILLRAAINELDWYAYNLAREDDPSQEHEEQFYILQLGVSRLIKLALGARPSFDAPTVTFRRQATIATRVLDISVGLGMIQHGRRVAQAVSHGLGEIEQVGDLEFRITLPCSIPDDEYYERAVSDHYRLLSEYSLREIVGSDLGRKLGSQVETLLPELVYPFKDHFIGYDADPTVDAYFLAIADHRVRSSDGYDSFDHALEFGGVAFGKFLQSLTFLVSIAMKHERFAEALVAKHPEVRMEDVLTISTEVPQLVQDISGALSSVDALSSLGSAEAEKTTIDEARTILEVLSVGRNSLNVLDRPGCPLPPLIRCSDHDLIRCQAGSYSAPTQFLLVSLRQHFPRDYDRHQRTREHAMRAAMKRVLDDAFPQLEYRNNIVITANGQGKTDIDLVVAEWRTGIVLLVQIKHQDPYGMDMSSMQSRSSRLKQQVERWLRITEAWLDGNSADQIRGSLRLRRSFPLARPKRIVVTRHFAFPLRKIDKPGDVAYGNWLTFFNAVEIVRQRRTEGTLSDFLRILQESEQPGGPKEHYPETDTQWVVDKLSFTTKREEH